MPQRKGKKKRARPTKNRSKPAQKPSRSRRKKTKKPRVMHPYLKCLAGPVSMRGSGIGYPDGSSKPTIVLDFHQTLTITPQSGAVRFAIVSSPYGGVAVGNGSVTGITVPKYNNTTDVSTGTWQSVTWVQTGSSQWVVAPFAENNNYSPGSVPFGPFSAVAFRGLMTVADVIFTGSTMSNGGAQSVSKTSVAVNDLIDATQNTVTVKSVAYSDLEPSFSNGSNVKILPARSSSTTRNVNPKPTFRDLSQTFLSSEICAMGQTSAGVQTGSMVWTGIDEDVPITVYRFTGLDSTASITVNLRSCLEFQIAPGSMQALTKPSPPASPSLWATIANYARSQPVLETMSEMGSSFARGFMGGSAHRMYMGDVSGGLHALAFGA